MAQTVKKNKTLRARRREIKIVSRIDENKLIVVIPGVLRIEPIRVEPQLVVVMFDIEHVQVAVRVSNV